MAILSCYPHSWSCERDERGQRDYHLKFKVVSNAPYTATTSLTGTGDGPSIIGAASALPAIGTPWVFGNDSDPWAICHPDRTIRPINQKDGESISTWEVECLFSTRPLKRCMTTDWGSPLLEPQKVSGSFVKGKVEAIEDRNGTLIKTSSHEMIRGPQVEFDSSHPTVRIEQNVSTLQLALCSSFMDHVNDDTLWGLVARRIKLSNFTWEEKWYDVCTYYYTRIFDFEIKNNENDLWDRYVLDEGTKVLNGHWSDYDTESCTDDRWITEDVCGAAPDPDNPQDFCRYKDRNGEIARVLLNGAGKPANATEVKIISPASGVTGTANTGAITKISIEYYPEANFTQLGIPTTLDFGTAT